MVDIARTRSNPLLFARLLLIEDQSPPVLLPDANIANDPKRNLTANAKTTECTP